MRKTSSALMALSLATLISAPALAASGDQGFATKAAQGGLAEVETGQLVQSKPGSQPVKQFAQTLVQDHSKANQELQEIAQQENVQLPSQPSEEQRMQMRKLQDLSGSALDRQFVRDEITDHKKTITLFEQEAKSGTNSALKAYAEKSLPVLRKHLQMAESLAGNRG